MVSGCASDSTFNLNATPQGVAAVSGADAARDWCDKRDQDLAGISAAKVIAKAPALSGAVSFGAKTLGVVTDLALGVATMPIAIAAGEAVIKGTTTLRDQQCAELRAAE